MSKKDKIKRFGKELPLPPYQTKGAAGFDLYARTAVEVKPGQVGYVPLNIAVETPYGHFLIVAARGSTHKLGLLPIHGIGIGDPDFRGDEDEYLMPLYNFTDKPVVVERGTRIGQGLFVKFERAAWQEVSHLKSKTRGGFGSTGHK